MLKFLGIALETPWKRIGNQSFAWKPVRESKAQNTDLSYSPDTGHAHPAADAAVASRLVPAADCAYAAPVHWLLAPDKQIRRHRWEKTMKKGSSS